MGPSEVPSGHTMKLLSHLVLLLIHFVVSQKLTVRVWQMSVTMAMQLSSSLGTLLGILTHIPQTTLMNVSNSEESLMRVAS